MQAIHESFFVGACRHYRAGVSQLTCLTITRAQPTPWSRDSPSYAIQGTGNFCLPATTSATTNRLCAQYHESLDQASGCVPRAR